MAVYAEKDADMRVEREEWRVELWCRLTPTNLNRAKRTFHLHSPLSTLHSIYNVDIF